MNINKFQQFKSAGAKLGKNIIGIMNSFGFTFSAGFYNKSALKNFKYVVLFYNKENGGSVGFYFTNDEEAEGRFTITHTERKTSGSVTCRSFFFNYALDKIIKQISGKYEPQEINHPAFGKMYYIDLNKKQS